MFSAAPEQTGSRSCQAATSKRGLLDLWIEINACIELDILQAFRGGGRGGVVVMGGGVVREEENH